MNLPSRRRFTATAIGADPQIALMILRIPASVTSLDNPSFMPQEVNLPSVSQLRATPAESQSRFFTHAVLEQGPDIVAGQTGRLCR